MRRSQNRGLESSPAEAESKSGSQSQSDGDNDMGDSDYLLSRRPRGRAFWSRLKGDMFLLWLRSWWRILVGVLTPLLLLPLPIAWTSAASRTLYVILIIAVYWVTEVIPIAGTSLLPLVLFPALGVLSADDTARNYLKDINMLFVGGLMMAVAVERWNLHKRMALLVLLFVGSKPKWLLLGFMGITGFLSMWISNTATAAMMLPIAQAVLLQLKEDKSQEEEGSDALTLRQGSASANVGSSSPSVKFSRSVVSGGTDNEATYEALDEAGTGNIKISSPEDESRNSDVEGDKLSDTLRVQTDDKSFLRLAKCLMLGVAYSANIGGTGTLTGTGPNIVLGGLASDLGINFGLWFVFAVPPMILALLVAWMYLSLVYCDDCCYGVKKRLFKHDLCQVLGSKSKNVIKEEYRKLGRIRYAEVILLVMFIILVLLWLFREPQFIPGWGSLFRTENGTIYVSDSTSAIAVVFILFLIPSEPCCCSWTKLLKAGKSPRLLDWDSIQKNLPWNVIIILGSGFAIAQAAEESGLSDLFGSKLIVLHSVPPALIAFLVSITVATMTEFISNVATTTLILPILRSLAVSICVHPLYLMIPATVSASFAFMFPVATPPNAVAFSYGYLKVYNMVLTGFVMNVICILIVTMGLNVIALPLFGLNEFPHSLINSSNCTVNGTLS